MTVPTDLLLEVDLPLEGQASLLAALDDLSVLSLEAPAPTLELAGRLAGSRPTKRSRGIRLACAAGALSLATAAGAGATAAANGLPAGAQRTVAEWSERHLPFSFPRPVEDAESPAPAPQAPSSTPSPQVDPARERLPGSSEGGARGQSSTTSPAASYTPEGDSPTRPAQSSAPSEAAPGQSGLSQGGARARGHDEASVNGSQGAQGSEDAKSSNGSQSSNGSKGASGKASGPKRPQPPSSRRSDDRPSQPDRRR